jgi:hypothetical protein
MRCQAHPIPAFRKTARSRALKTPLSGRPKKALIWVENPTQFQNENEPKPVGADMSKKTIIWGSKNGNLR